MKNVLIMLFVMLTTSIIYCGDSPKKSYMIKVDPNDEIVIELEGTIILENWDIPKLEVELSSRRIGKIWGVSNQSSRGEYDISLKRTGAEILLRTVKRDNLWSVGINMFREETIHIIHVPNYANIHVNTENGKVIINGIFNRINVENKQGDTEISIAREKIRYFTSKTEYGTQIVNNEKKEKDLKIVGNGDSVYMARSSSGDITINLSTQ